MLHKAGLKLDYILNPQSIAVVGASTRPGTVGNDIFRNLLFSEFNGSVFPVNPKARSVCGVHSYPTLADIPEAVDLGVLIVPSGAMMKVLDDSSPKRSVPPAFP
jgi:acetyltransferase